MRIVINARRAALLAAGCAFVLLGVVAPTAVARPAQQGSQPAPSLKQSASPAGVSQGQSSPPPSLGGSSKPNSTVPAGSSKAGAAPQPAAQPSPEESQDFQTLEKEVDPDKQVQMVKEFAQKYPSSQWLSDVYFIGATAAEQKNNVAGALDFGRRSLKLKPGSLRGLVLMAGLLPLPQALPATATERQQQLSDSENDATRALQLLSSIQPQPSVAPAQFNQTKAAIEVQLHSALAMAHLEESTMAVTQPVPVAVTQAKKEKDSDVVLPDPLQSCVDGLQYEKQNRLDDAISAFTKVAQVSQGGQATDVQAYASAMVQQLNVEKSQLASAEQEFKTVVAGPQPDAQDFYRLGEVYTRENKLDDAISAFTEAGQRAPGTLIQKYATQMIQQVQAAKAKNPPPASSTTAAPPPAGSTAPAASGTAPASPGIPSSKPAKP
ncbi:MAG: tetratricopeptide repeat protein [Terriglobia bacterium]